MYCSNCGEGIKPEDKFCSKCGQKIETGLNDQITQEAEPVTSKKPKSQRKQQNPFFILGGGIIAVFVLIGLVIYGIQWSSNKTAPIISSEANKASIESSCHTKLEALAKYQAKIQTSTVELIGSGTGGHVSGTVLYQNGFGAWARKSYRCTVASPSDVYVYINGELLNDLN